MRWVQDTKAIVTPPTAGGVSASRIWATTGKKKTTGGLHTPKSTSVQLSRTIETPPTRYSCQVLKDRSPQKDIIAEKKQEEEADTSVEDGNIFKVGPNPIDFEDFAAMQYEKLKSPPTATASAEISESAFKQVRSVGVGIDSERVHCNRRPTTPSSNHRGVQYVGMVTPKQTRNAFVVSPPHEPPSSVLKGVYSPSPTAVLKDKMTRVSVRNSESALPLNCSGPAAALSDHHPHSSTSQSMLKSQHPISNRYGISTKAHEVTKEDSHPSAYSSHRSTCNVIQTNSRVVCTVSQAPTTTTSSSHISNSDSVYQSLSSRQSVGGNQHLEDVRSSKAHQVDSYRETDPPADRTSIQAPPTTHVSCSQVSQGFRHSEGGVDRRSCSGGNAPPPSVVSHDIPRSSSVSQYQVHHPHERQSQFADSYSQQSIREKESQPQYQVTQNHPDEVISSGSLGCVINNMSASTIYHDDDQGRGLMSHHSSNASNSGIHQVHESSNDLRSRGSGHGAEAHLHDVEHTSQRVHSQTGWVNESNTGISNYNNDTSIRDIVPSNDTSVRSHSQFVDADRPQRMQHVHQDVVSRGSIPVSQNVNDNSNIRLHSSQFDSHRGHHSSTFDDHNIRSQSSQFDRQVGEVHHSQVEGTVHAITSSGPSTQSQHDIDQHQHSDTQIRSISSESHRYDDATRSHSSQFHNTADSCDDVIRRHSSQFHSASSNSNSVGYKDAPQQSSSSVHTNRSQLSEAITSNPDILAMSTKILSLEKMLLTCMSATHRMSSRSHRQLLSVLTKTTSKLLLQRYFSSYIGWYRRRKTSENLEKRISENLLSRRYHSWRMYTTRNKNMSCLRRANNMIVRRSSFWKLVRAVKISKKRSVLQSRIHHHTMKHTHNLMLRYWTIFIRLIKRRRVCKSRSIILQRQTYNKLMSQAYKCLYLNRIESNHHKKLQQVSRELFEYVNTEVAPALTSQLQDLKQYIQNQPSDLLSEYEAMMTFVANRMSATDSAVSQLFEARIARLT